MGGNEYFSLFEAVNTFEVIISGLHFQTISHTELPTCHFQIKYYSA